jgi:thiamine pyrophosphate-dependent acetolactate synthase large subunit-like protein
MEDTNIYSKIFMLFGKYGVKRIFGIPGREAQFYKFDEIPSISFVSMRNESAALISSGVYNFLMNGIKSVSWTTFGPGFANSVAGIYTCHMDGYPTIALSAQVETNLINPQTHQYINQEQLAKPISNFSYELKEDSNLSEVMSQAIINALTPKKDISFISIPLNQKIAI